MSLFLPMECAEHQATMECIQAEYEADLEQIHTRFVEQGGKYRLEPGEEPDSRLEQWLMDELIGVVQKRAEALAALGVGCQGLSNCDARTEDPETDGWHAVIMGSHEINKPTHKDWICPDCYQCMNNLLKRAYSWCEVGK